MTRTMTRRYGTKASKSGERTLHEMKRGTPPNPNED
jgi:hypothetical protein